MGCIERLENNAVQWRSRTQTGAEGPRTDPRKESVSPHRRQGTRQTQREIPSYDGDDASREVIPQHDRLQQTGADEDPEIRRSERRDFQTPQEHPQNVDTQRNHHQRVA